jgi:hypothetical protein
MVPMNVLPCEQNSGRALSPVLAMTILALFAVSSRASAESWTRELEANLTLSQTAYTDNWAGGEAGNLSWTFHTNALAEKKLHPRVRTKNTIKLFFGQTHSQNEDTNRWAKPVKSTDQIDFESIFNFTLGGFVDPFAAGQLESQFLDNSEPAKDRYFNPLKITESFGIIKYLFRNDGREWSNRLGGALRQEIDRDALADDESGKRETQTSNDGGLEFVSEFKSPLAGEKLDLASKLTLFQALCNSKADELKGQPNEDYWKTIDVKWETDFTASISKYLMVNLYAKFLYDKEVNLGGRFKQTLSLGLTYKLM